MSRFSRLFIPVDYRFNACVFVKIKRQNRNVTPNHVQLPSMLKPVHKHSNGSGKYETFHLKRIFMQNSFQGLIETNWISKYFFVYGDVGYFKNNLRWKYNFLSCFTYLIHYKHYWSQASYCRTKSHFQILKKKIRKEIQVKTFWIAYRINQKKIWFVCNMTNMYVGICRCKNKMFLYL